MKDILIFDEIKQLMKNKNNNFILLDTVDSTNNYLKKMALSGAKSSTIVAANEQTNGRGRLGRNFFSPPNTGIYMSILIRPEFSAVEAASMTISTCVAVCRVLNRLTGSETKIKWVNDIFANGKKVCGILVEGAGDFKDGLPEYAVIGIGINIEIPQNDFPENIRETAGAVMANGVSRNRIIAAVADEVTKLCHEPLSDEVLDEYKRQLFILGMNISYTKNGETKTGVAVDVNKLGNLIVRNSDGSTSHLCSGEVTLKSQNFI